MITRIMCDKCRVVWTVKHWPVHCTCGATLWPVGEGGGEGRGEANAGDAGVRVADADGSAVGQANVEYAGLIPRLPQVPRRRLRDMLFKFPPSWRADPWADPGYESLQ